jgi:hypothetical protein
MNEVFPVVSGLVIGLLVGLLRPSLRLGMAVLLSVFSGSLPPWSAASSVSAGAICWSTSHWSPGRLGCHFSSPEPSAAASPDHPA